MDSRTGALLFGIVVVLGGCTTALYQGARRPASEVARISTENTLVDAIDGADCGGRKSVTYELLPGIHMAVLRFEMRSFGSPTNAVLVYSEHALPVCFRVRAGGRYIATGRNNVDGRWTPEILEEGTARPISAWLPKPGGNCRRE